MTIRASAKIQIVGRIGPGVELTETAEFHGPTRTINLMDNRGVLHGRLQWLSNEMDEDFARDLELFATHAMNGEPSRRIGA